MFPTCCTSAFCGKIDCLGCKNARDLMLWYAEQLASVVSGVITVDEDRVTVRFLVYNSPRFASFDPADTRGIVNIPGSLEGTQYFEKRSQVLEYYAKRLELANQTRKG